MGIILILILPTTFTNMKTVIALFLGSASALTLRQLV